MRRWYAGLVAVLTACAMLTSPALVRGYTNNSQDFTPIVLATGAAPWKR